MIFDTHAHYMDEKYDEDREKLLRGLKAEGVGAFVEIGASIESSRQAVYLAEKYATLSSAKSDIYPAIYAAVGVHPDDVEELTEEHMKWLASLTSKKNIVAIGEIGLDYYYDDVDADVQRKWFERQLKVAALTEMPVVVHSRDAAKDTYDIMEEFCDFSNGGVIHCFSYSPEIAEKFVRKGFYIGVGGVVTFKNGKKLKDVVRTVDIKNIVLETDCPYLAPEPYRGKRNYSGYLQYVVSAIAEIKGMDESEVIRITENNAKKMYRI